MKWKMVKATLKIVVYIKYMANFESFCLLISSSINILLLKSMYWWKISTKVIYLVRMYLHSYSKSILKNYVRAILKESIWKYHECIPFFPCPFLSDLDTYFKGATVRMNAVICNRAQDSTYLAGYYV